jgi:DNA-binding MltR family transcriptional regulator
MKSRQPLSPESLSDEAQRLHQQLATSSDVAAIVVGVSYIDTSLASLLSKKLLKSSVSDRLLDSRSGALGTFSARTDMSYALALIDKPIYQELRTLGELRNEIAHSHYELSFSSPEVIERCTQLVYISTLRDSVTGTPIFGAEKIAAARTRFLYTASILANIVILTARGEVHAIRAA